MYPGTTIYTYNTNASGDGSYVVTSKSNLFDWHDIDDHSPNDIDGKIIIINANFTSGEFYRTTISGLCENFQLG